MDSCASSSSSSTAASTDSLISLKFRKKIYFEGLNSDFQSEIGGWPLPAPALPPHSPAKKGRNGIGKGGQPPGCQVEGCNVDLSDAKPYYSKHKVCGFHSKFPKVIVAGIEQRFCQQCSRFHQLTEFDREKRSCRRRLAGHNERRRKPLLSPRYGSPSSSLIDNHAKNGEHAIDFNAYSSLSGRDSWSSVISERTLGNQAIMARINQSPWQINSQNPVPDPLQGSTRPTYNLGSLTSSEECFNGVSDSTSALSLLSTQPWGSRTRSPSLAQNYFLMVQPSVNPPCAPTGQLSHPSWGFIKRNEANDTLHDAHPDPGSSQLPHPEEKGQYMGLAQPTDGQFHSSVQHMRWPL